MPLFGEKKTLEDYEDQARIQETRTKIAEQAALEAEAKKRYGSDWKRVFQKVGQFKSGIDWAAIKFRTGK